MFLLFGLIHAAIGDEIQPLVAKLLANDAAQRRAAALELGANGRGKGDDPSWAPAVDALLRATSDSEATVRRNALVALIEIAPQRADCAEKFVLALEDADSFVRFEAVRGLGFTGAVENVPRLFEIARSSKGSLQSTAIEGLLRIGDAAVDSLFELLVDATPATEEQVLVATDHLGNSAIPGLRGLLARGLKNAAASESRMNRPVLVAIAAVRSIDSLHAPMLQELVSLCDAPSAEIASAAIRAVPFVDSRARYRTSRLIVLVSDPQRLPSVRAAACEALGRLVTVLPDAESVLLRLLLDEKSTPTEVRIAAGQALSRSSGSGGSKEAIVPLLNARDMDPNLVQAVVLAIRGDSAVVEKTRNRLHAMFADPKSSADLRQAIVSTLGSLTKPVDRDLQLLFHAARAEEPSVALSAVQSLGSFADLLNSSQVTSLCAIAKHSNEEIRAAVATCLGEVRNAANAVPTLKKLLNDKVVRVRDVALFALAKHSNRSIDNLQEILKLTADGDSRVRYYAVSSILSSSPFAKTIVPQLIKRLDDDTSWVRMAAAQKLGAFGRSANSAIPVLTKALGDESRIVRADAMVALRRIDPDSARDFDAVVKDILANGEPDAVTTTLANFALLTGLTSDCVPVNAPSGKRDLVRLVCGSLNCTDERTRRLAAQVLQAIGPMAIDALDSLVTAARDPVEEVRTAVIGALASCVRSEKAREVIVLALSDPDAPTRAAACRAVALFGNWSADLKEQIRDLEAKDPDPSIRQIAAAVIKVFDP